MERERRSTGIQLELLEWNNVNYDKGLVAVWKQQRVFIKEEKFKKIA